MPATRRRAMPTLSPRRCARAFAALVLLGAPLFATRSDASAFTVVDGVAAWLSVQNGGRRLEGWRATVVEALLRARERAGAGHRSIDRGDGDADRAKGGAGARGARRGGGEGVRAGVRARADGEREVLRERRHRTVRRVGGARTRVLRVREGASRDAGERGGDDVRRRLRRVVVAERAPTRVGEGEARLTTRVDRSFARSVFWSFL